MQTEKELLTLVRSALGKHEKRPFDDIKTAVQAAQSESSSVSSGKSVVYRPSFLRFVPAVACLVLVAIGAVFYSSGGFSSPNMAPLVESTAPGIGDRVELYGFSAAGEAADAETPRVGLESPSLGIDPALLAEMEQYADQPDRLYAVIVTPDVSAPSDSKNTDGGNQGSSSGVLFLTAAEIYEKAAAGMTISPAPTD